MGQRTGLQGTNHQLLSFVLFTLMVNALSDGDLLGYCGHLPSPAWTSFRNGGGGRDLWLQLPRFDAAAGAMNRVGFDYVVEKVAVGYFSRDYSVSSARASRARDKCGHEDDPLAAARQRP